MKAVDYYIHKSSAEWEAVERWENEGGRLRQNHDLSLASIGEDHPRRMEQAISIGRLGEPYNIDHAMWFLASDEAKHNSGETLMVHGKQTLPESVSVV